MLLLGPSSRVCEPVLVPGMFPLFLARLLGGDLGEVGLGMPAMQWLQCQLGCFGESWEDSDKAVGAACFDELCPLVWVAVGDVAAFAVPNSAEEAARAQCSVM